MAVRRKPSVGWARSVDDLRVALRGIGSKEEQVTVLLPAVEAACGPILAQAKANATLSMDTGALQDSLVLKVVGYKNTGTVVGLVGPDRNYRVNGRLAGKLATLFGASRGEVRRPANYAHLVEFGHIIAKRGKLRGTYQLELVGTGRYTTKGRELKRWRRGALIKAGGGTAGGFVQPKPFLRPAVISTRAEQAAAFEAAVARGLDRLLAKYNKAGGTSVTYRRAA